MQRRFPLGALALSAVLLLAGCTSGTKSITQPTSRQTGSAPASSRPAAVSQPAGPVSAGASVEGPLAPQQVVKLVSPSVVRVQAGGSQTGFLGQSVRTQGTGTGMIIDDQGHILTNNHVITLDSTNNIADNLKVVLSDGRNVAAKVVGRDPTTDLAVLQISANNLAPVKFAASGTIEVGEPVLAIGYALNLQGTPTVTSGVVSALDRVIPEATTSISGALQTDASINPGNSGGPLVNLRGEVVGINTAGLGSNTQGIFFAISADVAQPIAKSLASKGKIDRGYIGIQTHSVTAEEARSQDLTVSDGAGIDGIQPGTPAEKAGIRPGDVIVKISNHDIHNTGDLQQALIENPPGAKITITYFHGKDKRTVDITLGTRPDNLG